jgi:hypothetical protein
MGVPHHTSSEHHRDDTSKTTNHPILKIFKMSKLKSSSSSKVGQSSKQPKKMKMQPAVEERSISSVEEQVGSDEESRRSRSPRRSSPMSTSPSSSPRSSPRGPTPPTTQPKTSQGMSRLEVEEKIADFFEARPHFYDICSHDYKNW